MTHSVYLRLACFTLSCFVFLKNKNLSPFQFRLIGVIFESLRIGFFGKKSSNPDTVRELIVGCLICGTFCLITAEPILKIVTLYSEKILIIKTEYFKSKVTPAFDFLQPCLFQLHQLSDFFSMEDNSRALLARFREKSLFWDNF